MPTITGVSLSGSTLTVTGSGFGTGKVTSLLWDDFEGGTNGAAIGATPKVGTWDRATGPTPRAVTTYTTAQAFSGTKSLTAPRTAGEYGNFAVVLPDAQRFYQSFRFRFTKPAGIGQVHLAEVWGTYRVGDYNPGVMVGSDGATWSSRVALENSGATQETGFTGPSAGAWHHFEAILQQSDVGAANGRVTVKIDTATILDAQNIVTRERAGERWERAHFLSAMTGFVDDSSVTWIDDAYVNDSWTRVELGDASTYAACTKRVLQPLATWADGSIAATLNSAGFAAGATVYAYVTDATGAVNATGAAVSLSGTPPDTTLAGSATASVAAVATLSTESTGSVLPASLRSFTTTTYANRTNTVVTVPAGVVNGDLLLLAHVELNLATVTAPAGWTMVTGFPVTSQQGAVATTRMYWRIASSEPASYTLTHASGSAQGAMLAVSGAQGIAPTASVATGNGLTTSAPSVTVGAGAVVVFIAHNWELYGSGSPPAGTTPTFTERIDSSTSLFYVADGVMSASGATGIKTQANGNNSGGSWMGALLAFEPVVVTAAQLSGGATGSGVATAALKVGARLAAQATASAVGSASLRVGALLAGQASSAVTASAALRTGALLAAQAAGGAAAAGSLTVGALLSSSATVSAAGVGTLSGSRALLVGAASCSVVASGVLPSSAVGQQYWEDWSGSTVGSAPTGWTARWTTSGVTYSVMTDENGPAGRALKIDASSNARRLLTMNSASAAANRSNFKIRALIKASGTLAGVSNFVGVAGRGAGSAGSETAYLGLFKQLSASSDTRKIAGHAYSGGSGTALGSGYVYTVGALYWVGLEASGTSIRMTAAEAATPGTLVYDETVTNSSISAAGWLGLFSLSFETSPYYVYAVGVGTNGADAPVSNPGVKTIPAIVSSSACVQNLGTGKKYYEKGLGTGEERIASITKIATAYILLQHRPTIEDLLAESVTITSGDLTAGGTGANIQLGDVITLHGLLVNAMVPSSNNSCMAIARVIGQEILDSEGGGSGPVTRFVAEMNALAASLGMSETFYENPHGLTFNNVSTPADQMKVAKVAWESAVFRNVAGTTAYDIPVVRGGSPTTISVTNGNPAHNIEGVLGVKGGSLLDSPTTYNNFVWYQSPSGDLIGLCTLGSSASSGRDADMPILVNSLLSDYPELAVSNAIELSGSAIVEGSAAGTTLRVGAVLTGQSVASTVAGGALTTRPLLAGQAVSTTGAAASLATVISLAGQASGSATATAALSVGSAVLLSADAHVSGVAAADVQTAIRFAGVANTTAAGNAQLATSVRLSAAASASGQAAGGLRTAIRLFGAATASTSASAVISGGAQLAGGATVSGTANADVVTAVLLSASASASGVGAALLGDGALPATFGSASASAVAVGSLQTAVYLSGGASISGYATGAVESEYEGPVAIFGSSYTDDGKAIFDTAYYEPAIWLEGAATATGVAENGDLVVTIRLVGDALGSGVAAAALAAYVDDGQTFVGDAKGSAIARAALTGDLRLTADATAFGIASSGLTTRIQLAGSSTVSVSADGTTLTLDIWYAGKAAASAIATGLLSTQVRISAAAVARAVGAAALTLPGRIEIPAIHRMAPMALRMIAKQRQPLVLRVILQDDYNTATGSAPQTAIDYDTVGVRMDYEQKYIDGTVIKAGDQKLLMPPQNVPRPQTGHQVLMGGKAFRVVSVGAVDPDGKPALYELQLRGVS